MKESIDGVVIETNDKTCIVKVNKHGECSHCGACLGENSMIITVLNIIGAKIGQHVCVEYEDKNILMVAFYIFILPLLAVSIGISLGLMLSYHLHISGVLPSLIGGLVFLILAVINIKRLDVSLQANKEQGMIVKVID